MTATAMSACSPCSLAVYIYLDGMSILRRVAVASSADDEDGYEVSQFVHTLFDIRTPRTMYREEQAKTAAAGPPAAVSVLKDSPKPAVKDTPQLASAAGSAAAGAGGVGDMNVRAVLHPRVSVPPLDVGG
jgi:hypothetical protein